MKNNNILLIVFLFGLYIILYPPHHFSVVYISSSDEEDEYVDNIEEPKRYYDSRYVSRKQMRINVPTRGEPPSYQQVGILTDSDNPENIKPLYGRQTYRGSNLWNYFTSLDSHLATKIPIEIDNNDCTDERGCKEIYKNDLIKIGDSQNQYKATIYNTHAPKYIPY